jgi:5-methylcytosine-specific restriction enzyme B
MAVIQKVIFGSPGTGKSRRVKTVIAGSLDIAPNKENYIPTVFHPEYTYGDFMGKLMPLSDDNGKVEYKFYAGHFLKALARAYKNIINATIQYEKDKKEILDKYKKEIGKSRQEDFTDDEKFQVLQLQNSLTKKVQNVLLVIDEINRGNSSAIFGTVFQLLDRNDIGWSEYPIILSDLEKIGLLKEIGLAKTLSKDVGYLFYYQQDSESEKQTVKETIYNLYLDYITSALHEDEKFKIKDNYIKLPPNLSIVGTMNTSDNSIYYMDSAFKRRWEWEFIDIQPLAPDHFNTFDLHINIDTATWESFVRTLNSFLKDHADNIRKIEDKQIGYYFIKSRPVNPEEIRNKLMFFLWDSVFNNDKKPLLKLVNEVRGEENKIDRKQFVTFGDFVSFFPEFFKAIENRMIQNV